MQEFIKAFAAIGGDVMAAEEVQNNVYDKRVEAHLLRIKELFNKLDHDKSGSLDGKEMKEVMTLVSGEDFDMQAYLDWYDKNGKGDGSFDVKEFGWSVEPPLLHSPASMGTSPRTCILQVLACKRFDLRASCHSRYRLIADVAGIDNEEKMEATMDKFASAIKELQRRSLKP